MSRILLVAFVIAAGLAFVKDHDVLRRTGWVGSCSVVHTPTGQTTDWRACRKGRLSGLPDLSRESCKHYGVVAGFDYWHCPARVRSGATGAGG